jgi:hypothetical protein
MTCLAAWWVGAAVPQWGLREIESGFHLYIVVYDDMMISNATFFRENVAPKKCCQHFFFSTLAPVEASGAVARPRCVIASSRWWDRTGAWALRRGKSEEISIMPCGLRRWVPRREEEGDYFGEFSPIWFSVPLLCCWPNLYRRRSLGFGVHFWVMILPPSRNTASPQAVARLHCMIPGSHDRFIDKMMKNIFWQIASLFHR